MTLIRPNVLFNHIHVLNCEFSKLLELKWYDFFKIRREIKRIKDINEHIINYTYGIDGANIDGNLGRGKLDPILYLKYIAKGRK